MKGWVGTIHAFRGVRGVLTMYLNSDLLRTTVTLYSSNFGNEDEV
jgi:succinate dehydrogenase hydrophobic anchor subunit